MFVRKILGSECKNINYLSLQSISIWRVVSIYRIIIFKKLKNFIDYLGENVSRICLENPT